MDFHFNINDYVKVKLTEKGINILKERHDSLNDRIKSVGGEGLGEFKVDKDKEGYTRFQMWVLMETFGPYTHIGADNCFDTDIIVCRGIPVKEEN